MCQVKASVGLQGGRGGYGWGVPLPLVKASVGLQGRGGGRQAICRFGMLPGSGGRRLQETCSNSEEWRSGVEGGEGEEDGGISGTLMKQEPRSDPWCHLHQRADASLICFGQSSPHSPGNTDLRGAAYYPPPSQLANHTTNQMTLSTTSAQPAARPFKFCPPPAPPHTHLPTYLMNHTMLSAMAECAKPAHPHSFPHLSCTSSHTPLTSTPT